jgi:beta-phosphoglucomutase
LIQKNCIDTLIFDYDGVIADTEPLHWRAWADILEPRGIHFTWDKYCEIGRGVHDAQILVTLAGHVKDSSLLSGLEGQIAACNEAIRDMCINAPPIHKATIELLLSLKSYQLGLVTSSVKSEVEPVLRAAGVFECFDAAVFGNDVERHKPAPDPYILLGKLLGVKTGLAFEDSSAGIASARQAGFEVIPVADPAELPQIVHRAIHNHQSISNFAQN